MRYDVTLSTDKPGDATKTARSIQLSGITIPPPAMSTREYFYGKTVEQIKSEMTRIPPSVGIQLTDGTVISVHQIELMDSPEFVNWLADPTKPLSTELTQSDIDGAHLTYSMGNRYQLHIDGNRNSQFTDDDMRTLSWNVKTVRTTDQTDEVVILPNGNISLKGTSLTNTALDNFQDSVDISSIQGTLANVLYEVQSGKWYMLPSTVPLTDSKFISALKGLNPKFITSSGDKVRDGDIKNAALVYIQDSVVHVNNHIYRPTLDYSGTNMSCLHVGGGTLEYIVPMNKPKLPRGYVEVPKDRYDKLTVLHRDRFPLDFIIDMGVAKGFRINTENVKRSLIIMSPDSNWAKSTLFKAAFIELNIGSDNNFVNVMKSIGQDGSKGSKSLLEMHTYMYNFYDEFEKVIEGINSRSTNSELSTNNVVNTMKLLATGSVTGDSKNKAEVSTVLSLAICLAANELGTAIRSIAANKELDTRGRYPAYDERIAALYFSGYSVEETFNSFMRYVHDRWYETYNRVKLMSKDDRNKWADTLECDEGSFDREKTRDENAVLHTEVLYNTVAHLLAATNADLDFEEEFTKTANGIAIRAPFRRDRGFYYSIGNIINDQSISTIQQLKYAKELDLYRAMCLTDKNRTYYLDSPALSGRSVSTSMFMPLDFDVAKKSKAEIIDMIEDKDFRQAVIDNNLLPLLLAVSNTDAKPNPIKNAILVALYVDRIESDKDFDFIREDTYGF